MADSPFRHRCQPLDDALAELMVLRLIHAMRPYMASAPLTPRHPAARIPRQRRHTDGTAERRIHALRTAAPPVPEAEPEPKPEPWWPVRKGVRVAPTGGHL